MKPLRVLISTLGLDQHEVGAIAVDLHAGVAATFGPTTIAAGRLKRPR